MEKFIYEQISPEVTIGVYIQPPQKRTIFFQSEFLTPEKYFIPLPHVAFISVFMKGTTRIGGSIIDGGIIDIRMAFLDSGELTDDSILYVPYLPNVNSRLKLCLGTMVEKIKNENFSKAELDGAMLKIADITWNSTFTSSITSGIKSYKNLIETKDEMWGNSGFYASLERSYLQKTKKYWNL